MAINLKKGQTINLRKEECDLSKVTIGLGWHVKEAKKGFLGSVFGAKDKEADYDLDAIAFLMDDQDKVRKLGDKLVGGDVIFYNNKKHTSGTVWSSGDNLVGGTEDADCEQIVCLLTKVPQQYAKILFIVSIYQGVQKNQSFGNVDKAYIRAVDAKGKELARFDLSSEPSFANKRSMVFAEMYRDGDEWKFRALGDAEETDNFVEILKRYIA
jgi:tellurium resistance protein TerD